MITKKVNLWDFIDNFKDKLRESGYDVTVFDIDTKSEINVTITIYADLTEKNAKRMII